MARDDREAAPAPPAPKWITVRALHPGTSVDRGNGRHYFRERGDVFEVAEAAFAGVWMARADPGSEPPPLPKDPPPTTLPAQYTPRPVTG